MTTIAVIGTGNMGAPMSRNLNKAGFRVQAYDIVEEKLEPLACEGIVATRNHVQSCLCKCRPRPLRHLQALLTR